MKITIALCGLLAILGVALFMGRGDRAASEARAIDDDSIEPVNDPALLVDPIAESEALAREPIVVEPTEPASAELMGQTLEAPSTIRGTITLIDQNGETNGGLDGSCEFVAWVATRRTTIKVDVVAGRFEIDRDANVGRYTISGMDLGGLPARLAMDSREFPNSVERIDIVAERTPTLRLEVVDATTGAALSDVSVLTAYELSRRRLHPANEGEFETLMSGGNSPVELIPTSRMARSSSYEILVGSKGYAWTHLQVDFTKGGERMVGLAREARLELNLVGDPAPYSALVRFYPQAEEHSRPELELPVHQLPVQLDGLQLGSFEARVEVGEWWSSPVVLGATRVDLVADATIRATLDVRMPAAATTATLGGVVVSWSLPESTTLHLEVSGAESSATDGRIREDLQLKEPVVNADGSSTWGWSLEGLEVGVYHLQLRTGKHLSSTGITVWSPPVSMTQTIELFEAGRENVRLEIPKLHPIHVTLRTPGGEALPDSIPFRYWSRVGKPAMTGQLHESEGRFLGLAPTGEIRIRALMFGYASEEAVVQVREGTNDFVVQLRHTGVLHLSFRDGDTIVPLPGLSSLPFEAVGHEGTATMSTTRGGVRMRSFSAPGLYRFDVPAIAGFKSMPTQEVEIVAGETTELVIDLERTH